MGPRVPDQNCCIFTSSRETVAARRKGETANADNVARKLVHHLHLIDVEKMNSRTPVWIAKLSILTWNAHPIIG